MAMVRLRSPQGRSGVRHSASHRVAVFCSLLELFENRITRPAIRTLFQIHSPVKIEADPIRVGLLISHPFAWQSDLPPVLWIP